jgi:hypothetical protein
LRIRLFSKFQGVALLLIASAIPLAFAEEGDAFKTVAHPEAIHEDTYDITTHKWIHYDPEYLDATPNWAFQILGSTNALGANPISAYAYDEISSGITINVEYEPTFLQKFGLIGVGPVLALYPTLGTEQSTQSTVAGIGSIFGVGGELTYQAQFLKQQLVVPFASFEVQYIQYTFQNGPQGSAALSGPSLGVELLLNKLDPDAGRQFFISTGLCRAYAVVEIKALSGSDANISVSGNSIFFGFRFER